MSPTSCRCSTPLQEYTAGCGTPRSSVSGREATPKAKLARLEPAMAMVPQ